MPYTQTYGGCCHCGRVRYQVTTNLEPVYSCNCSICQKRGALWTYVTPAEFNLLSGQDELSDYQFNKKNIHHLFCKVCGIGSYGTGAGPDGKQMYSINVRCLDGVDVNALDVTHYDGKNL